MSSIYDDDDEDEDGDFNFHEKWAKNLFWPLIFAQYFVLVSNFFLFCFGHQSCQEVSLVSHFRILSSVKTIKKRKEKSTFTSQQFYSFILKSFSFCKKDQNAIEKKQMGAKIASGGRLIACEVHV